MFVYYNREKKKKNKNQVVWALVARAPFKDVPGEYRIDFQEK